MSSQLGPALHCLSAYSVHSRCHHAHNTLPYLIRQVEVSDTESEATYQELFRSLKERGLKGVEQLVVSDDHKGLKAAITRRFQGASWQRCQVHYARNLLGMVGNAKRKELAADPPGIFATPDRRSALELASSVAEKWRMKATRW